MNDIDTSENKSPNEKSLEIKEKIKSHLRPSLARCWLVNRWTPEQHRYVLGKLKLSGSVAGGLPWITSTWGSFEYRVSRGGYNFIVLSVKRAAFFDEDNPLGRELFLRFTEMCAARLWKYWSRKGHQIEIPDSRLITHRAALNSDIANEPGLVALVDWFEKELVDAEFCVEQPLDESGKRGPVLTKSTYKKVSERIDSLEARIAKLENLVADSEHCDIRECKCKH